MLFVGLKKSFEVLETIQILSSKLKTNLEENITLYNKNLEENKNEIKANLVEYNKQKDELQDKILEFENINNSSIYEIVQIPFKIFDKKAKKISTFIPSFHKNKAKVNIKENPHDYNILTISEKDQKAYLPFNYHEVEKIYKTSDSKYLTMQDVIDDLYVLPLSQFKNSSIARFREAFHLMRNKENASITKALDLGLELMFQYNLNPIVIAACRNLNELDIYLDCLAENELYDFTCFEIKFEIAPKLIQKKK